MNNIKSTQLQNQAEGSFVKDNDTLFDILINQNSNGLFYLENDVLIYANDAFAKVLKTTNQLVQGKSILSFLTNENRTLMEDGIENMLTREKKEFQHDFLFENQEGNTEYYSIQLKIQSHTSEKLTIIGSSHNVTTRVLKQKAAQDSKIMFDALYCNIIDGIIVYDYNKEQITDCNDAALKIFGHKKREALLKRNRFQFVPEYSDIFPEGNLHEQTSDHGIRVRKGEGFKTAGIFVKADGEHIIVHATIVPTFRAHGEAFIVFQDSTKRMMSKKAQRISEKKYREIFNNSHEGIIYMDAVTFFPIMCNEQNLKIFGVQSFEEFAALDPEEYFYDTTIEGLTPVNFYISKMKEAVALGRSESGYRIKSQTGEIIRVSVVMICDRSDDKDPKVISFVRDVTNLHKTRMALNDKNEELEKYIVANLQLENFAYFASHDLQTPLRSIISFTQLLNRSLRGKISDAEQEYMDFIIASGKNMRNLVNDLLSYSRVNTTGINLEEVDVSGLVNQLCIELTTIIEEKSAKIELDNLPTKIWADSTKLRQVFQNLVTNAVKFSNEENIPIIKISCQEEKKHWLFSVADNGIGIHPDFQERIFLLFKRLHSNSEYEGTGIGLAMVKKIVEQHEGKIWLESEPEKGATFYFTVKKNRGV